MQKIIYILLFVVISALLLSCNNTSDSDMAMMAHLNQKYGDRYEFKLTDICMYAFVKQPEINKDEILTIYKEWRSVDSKSNNIRKTSFVYLNVYDQNGEFVYQLYFDPKTNAIANSSAEHY